MRGSPALLFVLLGSHSASPSYDSASGLRSKSASASNQRVSIVSMKIIKIVFVRAWFQFCFEDLINFIYTHRPSQKALVHQAGFHLVFSWLSWFLSFKVLLTFVLWVADKRVAFILSLLRGKGKGVVLELTRLGILPPSSFQPQFWVSKIFFTRIILFKPIL